MLMLFSQPINLFLFHSALLKDTDCILHHFFIKCHNSRLTEAHALSFNSAFLNLGQLRSIHASLTPLTTRLLKQGGVWFMF